MKIKKKIVIRRMRRLLLRSKTRTTRTADDINCLGMNRTGAMRSFGGHYLLGSNGGEYISRRISVKIRLENEIRALVSRRRKRLVGHVKLSIII